ACSGSRAANRNCASSSAAARATRSMSNSKPAASGKPIAAGSPPISTGRPPDRAAMAEASVEAQHRPFGNSRSARQLKPMGSDGTPAKRSFEIEWLIFPRFVERRSPDLVRSLVLAAAEADRDAKTKIEIAGVLQNIDEPLGVDLRAAAL